MSGARPACGEQVRVIEHGTRSRRAMQQLHLAGVLSAGPMEASVTPIIPGQRAPFHLNAGKLGDFAGGSRLSASNTTATATGFRPCGSDSEDTNDLDWELGARSQVVRCVDDLRVFVRTERAAQRVFESV